MNKYMFYLMINTVFLNAISVYDVLGEEYVRNKMFWLQERDNKTEIEAKTIIGEEALDKIDTAKNYLGEDLYSSLYEDGYSFWDISWAITKKKRTAKKIAKITFSQYLQDLVVEINKFTPSMIDEFTKFTSIQYSEKKKIYNYTLINVLQNDINISGFQKIKKSVIANSCSKPPQVVYLKYGYKYEHKYYDEDNNLIYQIDINISDCKQSMPTLLPKDTLVEYLLDSQKIGHTRFPKMLNNKARVDSIKYNEKISSLQTSITFIENLKKETYTTYMTLLKEISQNSACSEPSLKVIDSYGIKIETLFYEPNGNFLQSGTLDLEKCAK